MSDQDDLLEFLSTDAELADKQGWPEEAAKLRAVRAELERLRAERIGPGSPSERLKAISQYAVEACSHDPLSARGGDIVLIEDHKRLRAVVNAQSDMLAWYEDETDLSHYDLEDLPEDFRELMQALEAATEKT